MSARRCARPRTCSTTCRSGFTSPASTIRATRGACGSSPRTPPPQQVTGVRDSDAIGRRPEEAFPALSHLDLSGTLAEVVRSGVQVTLDNVVTRDTAYAVHAFPLPDQGVGLTIEDITDRTLAEKRARHQALHDGLTGLPNRVMLVDRLQEAIDASPTRRRGRPRHRSVQGGERDPRTPSRRPPARAGRETAVDRRARLDHSRARRQRRVRGRAGRRRQRGERARSGGAAHRLARPTDLARRSARRHALHRWASRSTPTTATTRTRC